MKKILLLFSTILTTTGFCQDTIPFETTTWDCNFHERGLLFFNADQSVNGLMNKTLNASPLFASHIWISSKDNNGQFKTAVSEYGNGSDFIQGPFRDSPNYRPNSYITITRAEIDAHIADYNEPGYTIPPAIQNWPAIGDTAKGEALAIAPFIDVNSNGCYDPQNGDYPAVLGDYTLYFIYSNGISPTTGSGSEPMDMEVHSMIYGFIDPNDQTINDAIFIRHTLINRSDKTRSIRFGQFFDFDLGNPLDDFVGCDSTDHSFFVYNGDNNDDQNSLTPHFGENPPAFGVRFLSKPLDCFISYGFGGGPTGSPATSMDYFSYMLGIRKDGLPFSDNNGNPTKMMYSGDPVSSSGQTETSEGNPPGDRRTIASFNNEISEPNDRLHYDLTMYLGNGENTNLLNVSKTKEGLTSLAAFFSNQSNPEGTLATNKDCQTSTIKDKTTSQFSLF
ncbi:MAG: hypothetical protein ACJAY8_000266, partial [Sphingobacteriales bacterium]